MGRKEPASGQARSALGSKAGAPAPTTGSKMLLLNQLNPPVFGLAFVGLVGSNRRERTDAVSF